MEDVVPQINRDLSRLKKKSQESTSTKSSPKSKSQNKDTSDSSNSYTNDPRPTPTKDPRSFVEYTSGTSNFEDLKLKAKNSWGVGVDLKLKENVKKPKQQWLNEDELFPVNSPTARSPKQSLSSFAKTDVSVQVDKPETCKNDNNPTWADTSNVVFQPMPDIPPPLLPEISLEANWQYEDRDFFIMLYKSIGDSSPEAISFMKDNYLLMLERLPVTPLRVLGYIFQALTILIESDCANGYDAIIHKVVDYMTILLESIEDYMINYAVLPSDYLKPIKLIASVCKHSSIPFKDIPLQELIERCKWLTQFCRTDESIDMISSLHMLIGESANEGESLLPVPDAKDFIIEAFLNKPQELRCNVVQGPWPGLDLRNYLYTHYMLCRQDLMKPVQASLGHLIEPENPTKCHDSVALYCKAKPIGILPHMGSFQLGVVFSLEYSEDADELMYENVEGSFAYLVSNRNYSGISKEARIELAAKESLVGYTLQSSSTLHHGKRVRLLPVCLNAGQGSQVNWSMSYTIIISRKNASTTLATMQWLRENCNVFNLDYFSTAIAPRVLAAKNDLSMFDPTILSEYTKEDSQSIPDYLQDIELDISTIMINKHATYKVKPSLDVWPMMSRQWNTGSSPRRPSIYEASPSQLRAIQYALNHRVALVSGAPGTGKTYLAGKLAILISQALDIRQFRQPLLVISKTQTTLDCILKSVASKVSDTIRFGYNTDEKSFRQATHLSIPKVTDQEHRPFQKLERRLCYIQAKLDFLCKKRLGIEACKESDILPAIPPAFMARLQEGYKKAYGHSVHPNEVWNKWISISKSDLAPELNDLLAKQTTGKGVLPMIDAGFFMERKRWIANNTIRENPITEAMYWPFESSSRTGSDLREELSKCWTGNGDLWKLSTKKKAAIVQQVVCILLKYIDYDIQYLLKEHSQDAQTLDNMMIKQWSYLVRFNRVIGITADFAAAHQSWLSKVWPRCVIVDEASDILESTLASNILGSRVEHLILLGSTGMLSRPAVSHSKLKGDPYNIDISLFERWKRNSPSEVIQLEEQWRMHSNIGSILDTFNSTKKDDTLLLITASLVTCNENLRDDKKSVLYGLNHRMFYLNYQKIRSKDQVCPEYRHLSSINITQAEVDEAQFVAHLATYISQQPYTPAAQVAILTVCDLQKELIQHLIKKVISLRTTFKKALEKIKVANIEEEVGQEFCFVVISTATPGQSKSIHNNVSVALSRAKNGVYIIGKPGQDRVHDSWNKLSAYMQENELYGSKIPLTCCNHKKTFEVGFWTDFEAIKNGGCNNPCGILMADGHVCPEECHHGGHEEVVCQEQCNRDRLCNHPCPNKCYICSQQGKCLPCQKECQITLKCGHPYTILCSNIPNQDAVKCTKIVDVKLSCGHPANVQCFETANLERISCTKKRSVLLQCGHAGEGKCGTDVYCTETCGKFYDCGQHICLEPCGSAHFHGRINCPANCSKKLICGHFCANGCANPNNHTQRCLENCEYTCLHGYRCGFPCFKECVKCVAPCSYKCKHYECSKKCYEICDRPVCNVPCKKVLECSHKCPGLCGEPCPPCKTCNPDLKCTISLRTLSEFELNELVYMLPQCGCVFSVESLDEYFKHQVTSGEHMAIKLWECPSCKENIYKAGRYSNYIKTELALVNKIKAQLEAERRKLTENEKKQIINAMNQEVKSFGVHNIVGGRWFVCPNKHPYFVGDCGGATEISSCPECTAPIGGTQHRVIESNRFYGEFDGSNEPAWPGQPN
ncbi:hypothetical protein BY458DRAFT_179428 [Sporodiniella umbellata]|nr:hypothetical protein BY458DRAFT_179428 [Sporodiniella umbellata]